MDERIHSKFKKVKKGTKDKPNLSVDDVVLKVDHDGPRNSWPMGIIVQTYPAKDVYVRVVDVKTKSGIFRRSVSSTIKLDVRMELRGMELHQIFS